MFLFLLLLLHKPSSLSKTLQPQEPKACTIVLRGASKDVLNEVERNLHVSRGRGAGVVGPLGDRHGCRGRGAAPVAGLLDVAARGGSLGAMCTSHKVLIHQALSAVGLTFLCVGSAVQC